jgi:ribosomal protein L39E
MRTLCALHAHIVRKTSVLGRAQKQQRNIDVHTTCTTNQNRLAKEMQQNNDIDVQTNVKADTDTDTPRGPAKKQKTAMMGQGGQGKAPQRPKKGAKRGRTQRIKNRLANEMHQNNDIDVQSTCTTNQTK